MEKEPVCQNCRNILPPGSLFCPQCGTHTISIGISDTPTVRILREKDSVYLPGGTVLHGKYRINHVLGHGGFGITYDGTDLRLQMHIAIKEYFPAQIADRFSSFSKEVTCTNSAADLYEKGMQNFLKEARNMAKFAGQPDFVTVHDYFAENNTAYIIMEYVEGQNLKSYIRQHGRLSMDDAMAIIRPVMDALEKIHDAGMIHRDVSSSNIMVLPDRRVRLLDFGAVRDISWEHRTMSSMSAVYKKGYSPIEQQTTDMNQGTYSDIYALCATLYEMITGSLPPSPFTRLSGEEKLIPPSSLGIRILPHQEKALLRGLEIYPQNRIQTVAELRDALSRSADPPAAHLKTILLTILICAAVALFISIGFGLARTINKKEEESHSLQSSGGTVIVQTPEQTDETEETEQESLQDSADRIQQTEQADQADQADQTDQTDQDFPQDYAGQDEDLEETVQESLQNDAEQSVILQETEAAEGEAGAEETEEEEPADEDEEQSEWYNIPSGALSYGGHHYYIFNDKDIASTWEEARDTCLERGGYLAVINDADENEELYQLVVEHGYDQAFFGLRYRNGSWDYSSGDTSDFRDWGYNSENEIQPNNADEEFYDVVLDTHMHDGHWSDTEFGKQTYTSDGHHYRDIFAFICEWDG